MKKSGKHFTKQQAKKVPQPKGDEEDRPAKLLTGGLLGVATISGLLVNIIGDEVPHILKVALVFAGVIAVLLAGALNWDYKHKWHYFGASTIITLFICQQFSVKRKVIVKG